jgi:branched-chain amino acid transport system substrate-binding protein
LAWLIAAALLGGCNRGAPTEPIVVGHLAPLSGPRKDVGEHARNGVLLAVEEVNENGQRLLGRRVEVLHADSGSGENAAGYEAVRLLTVNRAVALLGGTDPAGAEEIARVTQPYNAPFVTPSPLLGSSVEEDAFSTAIPPAHEGLVLARFAVDHLQVKHVAVVEDRRSPVGTAVAAAFARVFSRGEGTRVDHWSYEKDDFADLPGRLEKAKPAALLVAGPPADLGKVLGQLPADASRLPVLYGGGEADGAALLADGGAGHDVYAVTSFVTGEKAPRAQEFARKYQERFGEGPDLHAAAAYDGARLLFEAMRRAKSSKGEPVREALAGLENFESLTGPLSIDKETHEARRPAFVVTGEGGRTKVVERYDASLR